LLGEFALEEEMPTILAYASTDRALDINMHPSLCQITLKGVAIMSHSPEKMLDLVWALDLPNFLPNPIKLHTTPALLTRTHSIAEDVNTTHLVGTFDAEPTMIIKVPC
jgi:hypothetical protein